jgi:DNA-binding LytR/AlgR family response regulator
MPCICGLNRVVFRIFFAYICCDKKYTNMTSIPVRYLIVDDNELDRIVVETLAREYPFLQLCGNYANPLEAMEGIKVQQPDLILLDVEMPGATGIDLLKAVRDIVPMAIFITSYPEFALDGFELSALDYIVKPLLEERFAQSMKRVTEYWEMKQKSTAYDVFIEKEMITIKQGHDRLRLPLNDIIYLEALNDYTKLITGQKSYITIGALSKFLEQLPENHFCRIHRSYAIAIDKISALRRNEVECGGITLPVGKTYRTAIARMKL